MNILACVHSWCSMVTLLVRWMFNVLDFEIQFNMHLEFVDSLYLNATVKWLQLNELYENERNKTMTHMKDFERVIEKT